MSHEKDKRKIGGLQKLFAGEDTKEEPRTEQCSVPTNYFFSSSLILLTELDWHLGQARSTKGPFGSKGIINSFPQAKHLNLASSGIGNTV